VTTPLFTKPGSLSPAQKKRKRGYKMLYNLPYRPELNGVELFWADAKRRYRKAVLRYKATRHGWDQMTLASTCVNEVPVESARWYANLGWRALLEAEPLLGIRGEEEHKVFPATSLEQHEEGPTLVPYEESEDGRPDVEPSINYFTDEDGDLI
jgi:hypothetical protein